MTAAFEDEMIDCLNLGMCGGGYKLFLEQWNNYELQDPPSEDEYKKMCEAYTHYKLPDEYLKGWWHKILKGDGSYFKHQGTLVDGTTQSMLKKVTLNLKPEIRKRFVKLPIAKAVDLGWKCVR